MTVAFITSEYPHKKLKRSAGIGTSIKNLALGLISKNIEVVVFVAFQNNEEVFYDGNVKVISLARKDYKFFGWYLERKYIQKRVLEEINNLKIDLLEAPDWTGITAFMKFPVPLVIRLHGTDAYFCDLEGREQKFKHFVLERNALKNSDAIVSVSKFTADKTKTIFGLRNPIITIHNGINTAKFIPTNTEIEKGQLLYFGTIIRKKGLLELAHIFNNVVARQAEVNLLLVGKDVVDNVKDVSTIALFKDILSDEAKARVKHLEEVPYAEIKNYIARANVIVLPSLAEAFPMTWLETLAMEKALVSSNVGWAGEMMIQNKTGFMANPKDHEQYADFILKLLNDDALSRTLGQYGRKHVIKNFSTEKVLVQNIEFYTSLIDNNVRA